MTGNVEDCELQVGTVGRSGVKEIQVFKRGRRGWRGWGKWLPRPLVNVNKPAGHPQVGQNGNGGGFGVHPQPWKCSPSLALSLEAQVWGPQPPWGESS